MSRGLEERARESGGLIEMKRLINLFALLVATAVVVGTLMAQTKPPSFVGTWKLNLAKSKYEGTQAPKSLTRTVTAEGSGLMYSFEGEAADGSKISYSFTSKLDGSDSVVSGVGMPAGADTVALQKTSVHKIPGVLKKGGAKIGTATAVISSNGQTVTVYSKVKVDGKEVKTEQVYEKQ
jgi:hypothetical protein